MILADYQKINPNCPDNLLCAEKYGFLVKPEYFDRGYKWALEKVYLKKEALEVLKKAEKLLPDNICFLFWDGFRPLELQKELFDELYQKRKKQFPSLVNDELLEMTNIFVAFPDERALHQHGFTIDLTLFDKEKNVLLEMGTDFDDFSEKAHMDFFQKNPPKTEKDKKAQKNRELLKSVMIKSGFEGIKSEWWHFSLL